jgi:Inner membrane component of T3SS, cytoplasmic domain
MIWKKAILNALRWRMLVLGAMAGLWGSVLREAALLLPGSEAWPPLRALVVGAGLGLGLGLLLAPADALLQRTFRRALRAALAGGLLGALLGAGGAAAQVSLVGISASLGERWPWLSPALVAWLGLALTLGGIGAACGVASGPVAGHAGRTLRRALLGLLVGGVLSTVPALAAGAADFNPWAVLGGLVAWGALVALTLHGWAPYRARRWLRLLTGPGEDRIYPLLGGHLTLGKNERNDIPLLEFQEVYPYHCELRWAADHYDIVDNERGGVVLVNYRQVQEHPLKPGDLIKIGSALLQYGEAS